MTRDKCRSCGADIFWVKTTAGRWIPIDEQQTLEGNIDLDPETCEAKVGRRGSGRYISHFATCPNAGKHRRRKASGS